ncbi:hypothetical protein YC2023_101378 [Brassica napus]
MVWFCYELLYKDESTSLREDVQRREKYSADDSITKCGKSNHVTVLEIYSPSETN